MVQFAWHRISVARLLLQLSMLASASSSLLFWFFYFTLYWPYRNLFNKAGSYFDESQLVVYHAQNGLLILPALALLLLTLILGFFWLRQHRV